MCLPGRCACIRETCPAKKCPSFTFKTFSMGNDCPFPSIQYESAEIDSLRPHRPSPHLHLCPLCPCHFVFTLYPSIRCMLICWQRWTAIVMLEDEGLSCPHMALSAATKTILQSLSMLTLQNYNCRFATMCRWSGRVGAHTRITYIGKDKDESKYTMSRAYRMLAMRSNILL